VLEELPLWGEVSCRIWLPSQDVVVRVPKSSLLPLSDTLEQSSEPNRVAYIAAAAKVSDAIEGVQSAENPVLLAPMDSNVIPLPHQIHALKRAMSGDKVRYLFADEVGLGKTIEAGLVIRELKLRGLVKRVLVVAPKGLATQWVSEMSVHFNENFQLVMGEDLEPLKRISSGLSAGYRGGANGLDKLTSSENEANPWRLFDQVIVSLDSVKPVEKRRGWSKEKLDAYNRTRFEDLITAGWDLVIVDESHRLGGSSDTVARYKLGKGLAEAAPYFLLLSATPHQGKTDAFHRLISLLDDKAFPTPESVTRERVAPFVVRTEKRKTVDAKGLPLFKPRETRLIGVAWQSEHYLQEQLYEAVTDYVREGYNRALAQKKRHIGFLMVLMQRLVVSSTSAIRTTLERRLAVLREGLVTSLTEPEQLDLEHWYEEDTEVLVEEFVEARPGDIESEIAEVETLLDLAKRCEAAQPDAKAESLLELIYRLQQSEDELDLKVLIFTEFVPTQMMLTAYLEDRGFSVVTLNGSMDMDERKRAQDQFKDSARVLISTDAGGEGLNLQFCHVIVNYDIPWNPMRLEQRIGRVDRIGQPKVVKAINFVLQDSVEFRVREVLEEKLAIILDEFGVDKTSDVLDSSQTGLVFDVMFTQALMHPDEIEDSVEQALGKLKSEIQDVRDASPIYGLSDEPDIDATESVRLNPLSHWIEQMVVNYVQSQGGEAHKNNQTWSLKWPDGWRLDQAVFSAFDLNGLDSMTLLSLENTRVRGLTKSLPEWVRGQPIPIVSLAGLPATIVGVWALFEVRLVVSDIASETALQIPMVRKGYWPVFVNDTGKTFLPTAKHIWDVLLAEPVRLNEFMSERHSVQAFEQVSLALEQTAESLVERLRNLHSSSLEVERERGSVYFDAKRQAILKLGLPEVRQYRLARTEQNEQAWLADLQSAEHVHIEARALLVLKIEASSG
jgi:superfamily II DNA or RNA helicase